MSFLCDGGRTWDRPPGSGSANSLGGIVLLHHPVSQSGFFSSFRILLWRILSTRKPSVNPLVPVRGLLLCPLFPLSLPYRVIACFPLYSPIRLGTSRSRDDLFLVRYWSLDPSTVPTHGEGWIHLFWKDKFISLLHIMIWCSLEQFFKPRFLYL